MKLTYDEKWIIKETLNKRKKYLEKKLCYIQSEIDQKWINEEIRELEKIISKLDKEITRILNTTNWLPF